MATPAEEAVLTQDTTADRLRHAWSSATTAARVTIPAPTMTPPPIPPMPDPLVSTVQIALLSAAVAIVASATRRPDTSFEDPRTKTPAPPAPEVIRATAEKLAPAHAQRIWTAAHKHAADKPRGTDADFVRRASWTDGGAAVGDIQTELGADLGLTHKIWITRGDQKVREMHRRLHGHAVPLGKPFRKWKSGQVLDFPGDSRAPGDAWINCRCFMFLSPTADGISDAFGPADLDKAFALAASLEAEFIGTKEDSYAWQ